MSQGIGRQFMISTYYHNQDLSEQQKGLTQPPLELPFDVTQRPVALPPPGDLALEPVILRELIEQRATARSYADQPLTLAELSYLLWCTQGVKEYHPPYNTRRTVPSAGARHAFETILLVNRVDDLEPGLYRYVASQHTLIRQEQNGGDLARRMAQACLNQEQVFSSAVTFVWVAVPARMCWRYSERGYRYLHLDAGHVCQNLYLAAESVGCGVCAIAAFNDEQLNTLLELDGESQFVIYLASLGKKK